MSEPIGRSVRFREVMANGRAEKTKVECSLFEGKPLVCIEFYTMDKQPTLKRRGLSRMAYTVQQAKRMRLALDVAIEAAEAARTGRIFDADKALRERAGEGSDDGRSEAYSR